MDTPSARPLKRKSISPAAQDVADATTAASSSRARTRFIQASDLVILFMSRDRPTIPLKVTPGQHYINSYGSFAHDSFIGRPFGSAVRSTNNKGFVTLLRPTPELWTLSLPHRTQILYAPDMSFITMKLGLTPGARVVEAGTGSGSFTHFLARTVGRGLDASKEDGVTAGRSWQGQEGMGVSLPKGKGIQTRPPKSGTDSASASTTTTPPPPPAGPPVTDDSSPTARIAAAKASANLTPDHDGEADPSDGKVWTFEFHKERAARAREEFVSHNLTPLVSSSHRNVCLYGFPTSIDSQADAVFLDLPAPWEAIPFVPSVLAPTHTTRICCFSPCIEQVLRTVKALNEHGFKDVEMYESLSRTHESLRPSVMDMPLKPVGLVQDRLKSVLAKKEKISAWQKKRSADRKKREEGVGDGEEQDGDARPDDVDTQENEEDIASQKHDKSTPAPAPATRHEDDSSSSLPTPDLVPIGQEHRQTQYMIRSNVYSRTHPQMRGHTSYLTFATLLPRSGVVGASARAEQEARVSSRAGEQEGRGDNELDVEVRDEMAQDETTATQHDVAATLAESTTQEE